MAQTRLTGLSEPANVGETLGESDVIERILVLKMRLQPLLAEPPDSAGAGDPVGGEPATEVVAEAEAGRVSENDKAAEAPDSSPRATRLADAAGTSANNDAARALLARQTGALIGAADELLKELSGTKLAELQAANEVAQLATAVARAYLLSAKFIKSGGHYRVKKASLHHTVHRRSAQLSRRNVGWIYIDRS